MKKHHPIPNDALKQHIAILGKTGSGKSNLAKTIVEDLLERGDRVCVIDPTGTWFGLRLMPNGKPSPFEIVIFGGKHSDLEVSATHGSALARAVGSTSTSALIDTRGMSVADRTRFFTGFAETLIQTNQGFLTVVIDEAHLFMPQAGAKVGGGAPAMLHAGNNLVSLGRGVGLRIILISQRPAKLHKDALTQAETLVAMRLIHPLDRRAINDWMGEWTNPDDGEDLMHSLPSLATGDAWIWAPELGFLKKTHCPLARTYDSGRVRPEETPDLKPIDISTVAADLYTATAEVIANDSKTLKQRIRELEKQLEAPAAPDQAQLDAARAEGFDDGFSAGTSYSKAVDDIESAIDTIENCLDQITGGIADARDAFKDARLKALAKAQPAPPSPAIPAEPVNNQPVAASAPPIDGITGPQRRVLDALAWWRAIGPEPRSRAQVAVVAKYSPTSSSFTKTLSQLNVSGLITYPESGKLALTGPGNAAAARPSDIPTENELHARVRNVLNGPQWRILSPLLISYPWALPRDLVADAAGYSDTSSSFTKSLSQLRSLGLIDYPDRGHAVALPILFLN